MTDRPHITAREYAQIIDAIYGAHCKKKFICDDLGITRPTHNAWLKRGLIDAKPNQETMLKDKAAAAVTALRARARRLDRFTTG